MSIESSKYPTLKQKLSREMVEWLWILLYLAFFFCVFASYKLVILNQLHAAYFACGTAVFNALVLSKVILIGEYFGVARKHENRSVLVPAMGQGSCVRRAGSDRAHPGRRDTRSSPRAQSCRPSSRT